MFKRGWIRETSHFVRGKRPPTVFSPLWRPSFLSLSRRQLVGREKLEGNNRSWRTEGYLNIQQATEKQRLMLPANNNRHPTEHFTT